MSRNRLFLFAFCVSAIFAFVMAVLHRPPELPWHLTDKVQHVTAFVVMTVLALGAFPRARPIHVILSLSAFGALIEIVQSLPEVGRDSDWLDWLADTAAILGAVGVTQLLRRLFFGQAGTGSRA